MNIIDNIAINKRREVEAMKQIVSEERLFALARQIKRQPFSLKGALRGNYSGIIAEFKRRSPAKGSINPTADVASTVEGYARYGAAACSIVTDSRFFGGSLTDLAVARQAVHMPLLRNDFMVSKYQIAESYIYGADAVMLIASMLTLEEIESMMVVAHDFGMEVLVEIHSEREIAKIPACTDLVGV
ncbi:MAG: indole-3-glycerol-phosphate synthase, partial [Muribaculaceae bacterium]